MNAVLVLTKDKKQLRKIPLGSPLREIGAGGEPGDGNEGISRVKAFTIGRSAECDLRLEEDLASKQHAQILCDQGRFWLEDCGSTNGTSLNGKRLSTRRELEEGDEIGIGSSRLKFLLDSNGENPDLAPDEEATRAAGSNSDSEEKKPAGPKVIEKADNGPLRATVRILEGPLAGGSFRNWESPLTIGRGLENHVVLVDDAVSTRHARIVQESEQYFVEDLNSFNGTFLDGVKVQRARLANRQKIKVGTSTLAFELVDLRQRRRYLKVAGFSMASVLVLMLAFKFLLPPDVAGQHIELARGWMAKGDLARAAQEYQVALKIDPDRLEAKQAFAQVQSELDARESLAAAAIAAEEAKYEKAKDLVFRVLRDFPKNSRAQEMDAVIKSMESAEIALKARNWADAVNLLERSREKYPASQLLGTSLSKAQKELLAEQSLSKAKEALQHQQPEMAESFLASVTSNSVYFAEARELADKIEQQRKTTEWLNKANASYRHGQLTEALAELARGLLASPENPALLELQTRVRTMESLAKPLAAAEALKPVDSLDALLAARKTCDEALRLEPDPLNVPRKRAQETRARIAQWLQALSQSYLKQAEEALKSGDRKKAFEFCSAATKADETNQQASQTAARLRDQIGKQCQELYRSGLKFEELGFEEKAQENFRKVLEVGMAGTPAPNDYFEKTMRKLKLK